MKVRNLIFLLFICLLSSCKSYSKNDLTTNGKNLVIENAVLDFINTNKLSEKYSVFEVKIYNPLFKKVLNKKAENN